MISYVNKIFHDVWNNKYPTRKELKATIFWSAELNATKEATDLVLKILDSKYGKAHLNKIINDANNLNREEKRMLLQLLKQYEYFFDCTLGSLKTNPVKI